MQEVVYVLTLMECIGLYDCLYWTVCTMGKEVIKLWNHEAYARPYVRRSCDYCGRLQRQTEFQVSLKGKIKSNRIANFTLEESRKIREADWCFGGCRFNKKIENDIKKKKNYNHTKYELYNLAKVIMSLWCSDIHLLHLYLPVKLKKKKKCMTQVCLVLLEDLW